MNKVSINLDEPTPYVEVDSWFHRFKRRLTYKFAFDLIRNYASGLEGGSILEVGTGSGYFLKFAREAMPGVQLYGIEYDQRLLDVTIARAPFAHCERGNAETFELAHKQFDVVASFQVIEHLYNPSEMLIRVGEHIRRRGLLIVTSPNLGSIGARLMGKNWHGYRDDHVSLQDVDGWVSIIESHGFTCVYAGSTFFSGIPVMNKLPLGIINWALLLTFGSLRWKEGEAFVGAFYRN